ncbi:expressed unknown protein [Seminavis robusta]|uniref:Uncharacterized protein n=1 Tax=Seminavis robusta TaxID=568900 RepID=A0A9N8D8P6_9STRA|nr:expressed unknown protein [Seminavis robusta]|eukprot:Sro42_g025590.1 n/a (183) ;mRNA; r:65549-66097
MVSSCSRLWITVFLYLGFSFPIQAFTVTVKPRLSSSHHHVRGRHHLSPLFSAANSTLMEKSSLSLEQVQIEEQLLWISQMEDDQDRRERFELFLTDSIGAEKKQMSNVPSSSLWDRKTSPFVQEVQEQLKILGTAVQSQAWDKYVTSGFEAPTNQKSHLWACVDMTVQLQVVVRKLEDDLKP